MINSLEEIVNIDDRQLVECPVKSWGKTVMIRPLTSEQAEEITVRFSGLAENKEAMIGMRTALARLSIVNSEGQLLIKSDDDAQKLGEKSSSALKEIFEFCMDLNGFNATVEDEEKN